MGIVVIVMGAFILHGILMQNVTNKKVETMRADILRLEATVMTLEQDAEFRIYGEPNVMYVGGETVYSGSRQLLDTVSLKSAVQSLLNEHGLEYKWEPGRRALTKLRKKEVSQ
jgi:hypothetical protein